MSIGTPILIGVLAEDTTAIIQINSARIGNKGINVPITIQISQCHVQALLCP